MSEQLIQGSLFDENAFVPVPTTKSQWATRVAKLADEFYAGQADYERLLPERERYEKVVQLNRGKTKWNSRAAEYAAVEARAIMRFLKGWSSRRDDLKQQIDECNSEIAKLS